MNQDYPTIEDLMTIRNWKFEDFYKDYVAFAEYIVNLWHYGEPWAKLMGKKVKRLKLSTGGWSGNEEIIDAMSKTFFWMMCWERSERGGHYLFKIPYIKPKES